MLEWSASRMLTATRARPARHAYSPTPAGTGCIAPLAAEGVGALVDEPRPAPGDDCGGGLAGPLGGELAAGRADLLAAVPADRGRHAGVGEDRGERDRSRRSGEAAHGVWATGFIGIRLTWAWSPRRSSAMARASSSVSLIPAIIVAS